MENKIILFFAMLLVFVMIALIVSTSFDLTDKSQWRMKQICKDIDKRAKFIVDCARAGNPMSDEEGEDLVRQCDITSRDLFCEYIKEYFN